MTWALTLLGLRGLNRGVAGTPGRDAGAAAVFAGNLFAALACLPAALPVASATVQDGLVVAYLGVFQIGVAYVFLTRALRVVGALEAALLLLLEPVLNPLWAWLVHGERPGPWGFAGGAVIVCATAAKTLLDFRRTGER